MLLKHTQLNTRRQFLVVTISLYLSETPEHANSSVIDQKCYPS